MKKFKKCFDKFIWLITGKNSDSLAYKLISFFGLLVRVIGLPYIVTCAYKAVIAKELINFNIPVWGVEIIARLCVVFSGIFFSTKLINKIAYATVGNFYARGKKPEIGSLFYNLFYVLYQIMPVFVLGPFGWWGFFITWNFYILFCTLAYCVCSNPHPKEMRITPELQNKGTYPTNWVFRTIVHIIIVALVFIGTFLFKWFLF